MAFVLHLLRPAEHFVDVGANVGSHIVLASGGANACDCCGTNSGNFRTPAEQCGAEWNERPRPVTVETNGSGARYGISDDQLLKVMREHGFAPFGYDPFARRLVDVTDATGNTVFVRDRAAVEAWVKSAPKFRLVNGEI